MAYENAVPALRNTKEKYATDDEVCAGGSCRDTVYDLKLLTILFSPTRAHKNGRLEEKRVTPIEACSLVKTVLKIEHQSHA